MYMYMRMYVHAVMYVVCGVRAYAAYARAYVVIQMN